MTKTTFTCTIDTEKIATIDRCVVARRFRNRSDAVRELLAIALKIYLEQSPLQENTVQVV